MFSDSFSEGQERDINEGFPSDSDSFTEHYDYQSDSDLEDEELEGKLGSQRGLGDALDLEMSQTVVSNLPSPVEANEAQSGHRSTPFTINRSPIYATHSPNKNLPRMGKVAVIRDMAAVTCVRHGLSEQILIDGSQIRGGTVFLIHWRNRVCPVHFRSSSRPPCTSKDRRLEHGTTTISISKVGLSACGQGDQLDLFLARPLDLSGSVRLPILKEQAKVYIHNNLQHCNIVDEVFSSFSSL